MITDTPGGIQHTEERTALLIATLASFLAPFMGSSVNTALPTIGKEFAMDAVLLSWVTTSYLLTVAILLVPSGRLADIYGRKRVFISGITIYSIASVCSAFAHSAAHLIFYRILHGVGGAMIFSTGVAILTSVFPPEKRGRILGINVASVYFGLSLGPYLGGLLTEHLGWRSIFFSTLPLNCAVIVLTLARLPREWADARGERFDFQGALIYSLTIVAVMYGFSQLPNRTGVALVFAGILGALLFVKWESGIAFPLVTIDLFRDNRAFAFANLAAFINYSAAFATGFVLSLYLQYIKGFSPHQAGLILIAQPLVMAVLSPFAGRLSERLEPRIVASAGMSLLTVGLFLFVFLRSDTSVAFIVSTLVLHGIGFALFSSPNTNAVMSSVDKKFFGIASGMLGTMRATGMVFSMGIATMVFVLYIGRVEISPDHYTRFLESARVVFSILTVLSVVGVFASLSRPNTAAEAVW